MSDERSPRYFPIDRSQHVLLPLDVDPPEGALVLGRVE